MKALGIIGKVLFIICLPLPLLLGGIALMANNNSFYTSEFQKYNVGRTTGLDNTALQNVADGVISYFNSGEDYINLVVMKDGKPFTVFNEKEVVHLKDVKDLLHLDYKVMAGTLAYILAYTGICLFWQKRKHWRRLAQAVLGGSILSLALLLLLGIGSLFDFSALFTQFHLLSFTNDLWLLDPRKDYMIMLFTGGFFYDFVMFAGIIAAGIAVALGVVSGMWLKKGRNKNSPRTEEVR